VTSTGGRGARADAIARGAWGSGARADLRLALSSGPRSQAAWRLDAATPIVPLIQSASLPLGSAASLRRSELAVLEDHQRRDRPYIVARGRAMILIDVELDDLDLAVEFLGDLLERRCDTAGKDRTIQPRNPPRRGWTTSIRRSRRYRRKPLQLPFIFFS
jgi:hypothetical protein